MKENPEQHGHLPRLERECYRQHAMIHWTLTLADRATGWLNESFHTRFRELMLHVAAREQLFCPAYCLMPDHLHLMWLGMHRDTDQVNDMAFLRTHLEPGLKPHRFQHQAHDHVLRDNERDQNAFAIICNYILANPVRKGLVIQPQEWPFSEVIVPGYPRVNPFDADYWPKIWQIYAKQLKP